MTEQQRKHSDEDLMRFLVTENIELEGYYIIEYPFGEGIYCHTLDGQEADWLIEDEELRQDCISFLKEKGVPIIKIES